MTIERQVRMFAGLLILTSVGLGASISKDWYWLTAVFAASLFQSGFTNWCPLMSILRAVRADGKSGNAQAQRS